MRQSQLFGVLLGLCLLGVGGVAATAGAGTAATSAGAVADAPGTGPAPVLASNHVNACAAEPPADLDDPAGDTGDVVGWVDGYWYNEPINATGPALTEAELDVLIRRTAARVEALRCLAFEELPPTEMRTRDEHRNALESQFEAEVTDADERFDNALFSTTLIAGQSVDAVELQLDAQTSFPAAFYNIEEEFIGFITDDPNSTEIDQTILAHELVHALQDQNFELESVFEQPTTDDVAASLAVVEGDASLVEEQYVENCETGAWVDSCIRPQQGSPPEIPSWPLTLEQLAAYNMPLVEQQFERNGWSGVNGLLEERPDSAIEGLYPDRYGEFESSPPEIEDQSGADWERIELAEQNDDVFGQHALTSILMAPFYETNGQTEIIDADQFLTGGQEIDYAHPATDGWQGDRFYGYTNGESTAGVWALNWESENNATTFADAFEELAGYRGGTLAEGYENVYTFENSPEYNMALGLERDGDSTLVVTAPTVDGLTDVHGTFDAVTGNGTDNGTDDGGDNGGDSGGDNGGDSGGDNGGDNGSDNGGDSGGDNGGDGTDGSVDDDTTDTGNGTTDTGNGTTADGDGAGFGVVVVVGAIVAGLFVARRRHNR
jgi:hypothetical protein